MTDWQQGQARFTRDLTAVLVENLTIADRDVVTEAQRWTTGERGPVVDVADTLLETDLTAFTAEALRLGVRVLSVAGQERETQALEHVLKDVGDRTSKSTTEAVEATRRATRDAADAMSKAARDAQQTITDIDERNRKEFTRAVDTARQSLHAEVQRIFGGEQPDLLERLKPLLETFGHSLDAKAKAGTTELLDKAVKQFDPADPSSPIAKYSQQLSAHQAELVTKLNEQHTALDAKLEDLKSLVKVQEAKASLANVTPLKGDTYADRVNALMFDIASGLGDDYEDTSATTGNVMRSKKGDGVLTLSGGDLRIVLETTDSKRTGWNGYLDEAERNRGAIASLGLARTPDQNGGQTVRVLGGHRIVLAFDPDSDDPELLRTVVQLLRTTALTVASRKGTDEIATAEDKINEAVEALSRIDTVKKSVSSIQKSATKIDSECATLASTIRRLLDEALAALDGVATGADDVSMQSSGAA